MKDGFAAPIASFCFFYDNHFINFLDSIICDFQEIAKSQFDNQRLEELDLLTGCDPKLAICW